MIWLLFLFFLFVLAVDGYFLEPNRLLLKREVIQLPHWPAGLDGLRVAIISDLHPGSNHVPLTKVRHIVELVNHENPEIALFPGDFVEHVIGGRFIPPEETAQILKEIKAPKVAVLGNHDWYMNGGRIRQALSAAGIQVLENESIELKLRRNSLWIAGSADAWTRAPDILAAFNQIPKNAAVIALTHNPVVFPEVPAQASLTIAGHTHGGQINLPFITSWIMALMRSGHYPPGHTIENGRHLYVSAGVGTSILPIRFRATPEVNFLTLRP